MPYKHKSVNLIKFRTQNNAQTFLKMVTTTTTTTTMKSKEFPKVCQWNVSKQMKARYYNNKLLDKNIYKYECGFFGACARVAYKGASQLKTVSVDFSWAARVRITNNWHDTHANFVVCIIILCVWIMWERTKTPHSHIVFVA